MELDDTECVHLEGHHVREVSKDVWHEGLWDNGVFSFGRQIRGKKGNFSVGELACASDLNFRSTADPFRMKFSMAWVLGRPL